MLFGKTNKERALAEQVELHELARGQLRFALSPAKLDDGRWLWLGTYYCYQRVFSDIYRGLYRDGALRRYAEANPKYIECFKRDTLYSHQVRCEPSELLRAEDLL